MQSRTDERTLNRGNTTSLIICTSQYAASSKIIIEPPTPFNDCEGKETWSERERERERARGRERE